MNRPLLAAITALLGPSMLFLGGCGCDLKTGWERLFDPSAMVKQPADTQTRQLIINVSQQDEQAELPRHTEGPMPADLLAGEEEYRIGAYDVIDISILDLYAENLETVLRRQVSVNGTITLPLINEPIKAGGLTAEELQQVIARAYSPEIIKHPTIAVSFVQQRQNAFSIGPAVTRAGNYPIIKKDMRLMDALAIAGGVSQTNIPYIYIIRIKPTQAAAGKQPTTAPGGLVLPELPEIPDETPSSAPATGPAAAGPATASAPATAAGAPTTQELAELMSGPTARYVQSAEGTTTVPQHAPAATQPSGEGAGPVTPVKVTSELSGDANDPFGWNKIGQDQNVRIIAIDVRRLNNNDPQMNIVIRENDIINIPLLEQGEFYMMGEIARPGVYSLTGRQVTIKMAVAAAGGIGPLGWPNNSILIRRIGGDQEQIVPVDIEAIFRGTEADVILKPNDVIAVGTHVVAPFYAVFRNAFRMTYGFGFVYDRNFSDPVPTGPVSWGGRFTRL